jgi:hypothetical protein
MHVYVAEPRCVTTLALAERLNIPTHCPFPGGGYVGSRYLFLASRCWEILIDPFILIVNEADYDTATIQ